MAQTHVKILGDKKYRCLDRTEMFFDKYIYWASHSKIHWFTYCYTDLFVPIKKWWFLKVMDISNMLIKELFLQIYAYIDS